MVAPRLVERPPRLRNPRTVRAATQRRMVRKSRARYAGVGRVFTGLIGVLFLLMCYVLLTSSLTGLSYAVATARADREALQEETMRLDDRIAALRSDDRLAAIAARLGMREPETLAVVRIAAPRVAREKPRFAVLSSLAGFFVPVVSRSQ
jgi:cell division protein FtsL